MAAGGDALSFTQCQICLEDMHLRRPRALACLHTFCEGCLLDLSKTGAQRPPPNPFQAFDVFGSPGGLFVNIDGRHISCPVCRKNTALPQDGVKGLPINFMVTQLQEAQAGRPSQPEEKPRGCHNCLKVTPLVCCDTCDTRLCDACRKLHDSVPAFKKHKIRKLSQGEEHICGDHQGEAKYVCASCECHVCLKCVLSDKHRAHSDKIEEYSSWVEKDKKIIAEQREKIAPQWLQLKDRLAKATEKDQGLAATTRKVKKAAAEARAAITRDEEMLLLELDAARGVTEAAITFMESLCERASTFMQKSIPSQAEAKPSIEDATKLKDSADFILAEIRKLPKVDSLASMEFCPCHDVTLGTLRKVKTNN